MHTTKVRMLPERVLPEQEQERPQQHRRAERKRERAERVQPERAACTAGARACEMPAPAVAAGECVRATAAAAEAGPGAHTAGSRVLPERARPEQEKERP